MQIDGISGKGREIESDCDKKRPAGSVKAFKDSLFQNLLLGEEGKSGMEAAAGSLIQPGKETETVRHTEYAGMTAGNISRTFMPKKTLVEGIGYEQSDKVKIDILQGYTMKARLNKASGGNGASVYVEIKCDDGRTEAYIIDKGEVNRQSGNPVEQIAYEAFYSEK